MIKIILKEWYKKRKKNKIENKMKNIISSNKQQIKRYEDYLNNKFLIKYNNNIIAKSYNKNICKEFMDKYNVNKDLIKEQFLTYETAMKKYYELQNKFYQKNRQEEDNKKIKLYKKAILELKKEGKI